MLLPRAKLRGKVTLSGQPRTRRGWWRGGPSKKCFSLSAQKACVSSVGMTSNLIILVLVLVRSLKREVPDGPEFSKPYGLFACTTICSTRSVNTLPFQKSPEFDSEVAVFVGHKPYEVLRVWAYKTSTLRKSKLGETLGREVPADPE